MNNIKLTTVLTARTGSSRFPKKCLIVIDGKPLISWILLRLQKLPGTLILATTTKAEDDELDKIAKLMNIPVFRGSENDVVGRVNEAVKHLCPNTQFVFRALADCPFINTDIITIIVERMQQHKKDAAIWHLEPNNVLPVYGSREFPYSITGWNHIVEHSTSDEREHIDLYFHRNRDKFSILYNEPPESILFRQYRFEVDWPEDINVIKRIASHVGMLSPLKDIISFMDENPDVPLLNIHHVERTGPLVSYNYAQKRIWMKEMQGKPVLGWDGQWIMPPNERGVPVFCKSGKCFIGYGSGGVLYRKNGDRIVGKAYLACTCKSGLYWKEPIKRRNK